VFQPENDTVFLLDDMGRIFQVRSPLSEARTSRLRIARNNNGEVLFQEIVPSNGDEKYLDIAFNASGNLVFLRSASCIDIRDLNWSIVSTVAVPPDVTTMKVFSTGHHGFLILSSASQGLSAFYCQGVVNTEEISMVQRETAEAQGNPIVDIVHTSFGSFGPHLDAMNTSIQLQTPSPLSKQARRVIQDYISDLFRGIDDRPKLGGFITGESPFPSVNAVDTAVLCRRLFSRVPVHVATIEEGTIMPLRDGRSVVNEVLRSRDGRSLLQRLCKLTQFGHYERVLQSKRPVFVVSIVGRQSSGKSYLLNRLFGCRFNTSSSRCTDGIWLTLSEIDGCMIVVMDCEGLFSLHRNGQEEMKLLLTLAAVSNVLLVNQDMTFSRHLNSLFESFERSVNRLKGSRLFRGKLAMVVRDVPDNSHANLAKEFSSYLHKTVQEHRSGSFISKFFQGTIDQVMLHHFQQPTFAQELNRLRERVVSDAHDPAKCWSNSKEFLDTFKLILAQIYADDDSAVDEHLLLQHCETLFQTCEQMFLHGVEDSCLQAEGVEKAVIERTLQADGMDDISRLPLADTDITLEYAVEKIFTIVSAGGIVLPTNYAVVLATHARWT